MSVEPFAFADVIEPLCAAAVSLRTTGQAEWSGPLLSARTILACAPNIDERLADTNEFDDHDRAIVTAAFHLGIEQGLRMFASDNACLVRMIEAEFGDRMPDSLRLLLDHVARPGGVQ